MVSKRLKLYCFYCKYESSKYNKSNKFVKFKGKLKSICKFCNKNKHKTLETKYKAAIAALKGQFVGHCYHSIVFSKGPQTFFGNFLG